ncbi:MAG: sucrose synthase [Acidobacteria bacterium]|nr:sucrose synthase [Acidobacteriota bacterium]
MTHNLYKFMMENRKPFYLFFRRCIHLKRKFLLQSDLWREFEAFGETETGAVLRDSVFEELIRSAQVAAIQEPWMYVSFRSGIAKWRFLRFHVKDVVFDEVSVARFLSFQESLVSDDGNAAEWALEVDLLPFNRGFPRLKETRSIGRGVEFLNRHLCSVLFAGNGEGNARLLRFLQVHKYKDQQLMLNDRVGHVEQLQQAAREAVEFLESRRPEEEWTAIAHDLQALGFESGWGRTVKQILVSLNLLIDILEAPEPNILEEFLGRVPMIFSLVILSPHGYFGQSDVLGLPDTGGQVVYILDQVRALEKEMRQQLYDQGLDIQPEILIVTRLIPDCGPTSCDRRTEKVVGCRYARILRVPFRNEAGEVIPHWVSRFRIWPYLEQFTLDVEREIMAEMGHRPDLIIGNYSDGNLVATLLSQRLGVTQGNIAHALEKTKYLFSDLYWQDNEEQYHFSTQFTADLIAMNTADFIITSTYHEIAGNRDSIGQYESYSAFTLPGLYRVVNGIDVFDPKFNIVSPGANAQVFFPYHDRERRLRELHAEIRAIIFGRTNSRARGAMGDDSKPVIFAMSRLDHIKNITGLVRWYARSERLQQTANLFVVAGFVDGNRSKDDEERGQIAEMHHLFDEYGLEDRVRWFEMQSDKNLVGELYRFVADTRGIFVQPALFEAFGLTVVEAMVSGLPTFATCFGGPREIIEHGVSGFHIDPNRGDEAAAQMADFFDRCREEPDYWETISNGGIQRVEARYTWQRYARRLTTLARIYGFWKYVSNLERQETRRYLEMFYSLMFRQLAERSH